jgi:hypothetical protein
LDRDGDDTQIIPHMGSPGSLHPVSVAMNVTSTRQFVQTTNKQLVINDISMLPLQIVAGLIDAMMSCAVMPLSLYLISQTICSQTAWISARDACCISTCVHLAATRTLPGPHKHPKIIHHAQ